MRGWNTPYAPQCTALSKSERSHSRPSADDGCMARKTTSIVHSLPRHGWSSTLVTNNAFLCALPHSQATRFLGTRLRVGCSCSCVHTSLVGLPARLFPACCVSRSALAFCRIVASPDLSPCFHDFSTSLDRHMIVKQTGIGKLLHVNYITSMANDSLRNTPLTSANKLGAWKEKDNL